MRPDAPIQKYRKAHIQHIKPFQQRDDSDDDSISSIKSKSPDPPTLSFKPSTTPRITTPDLAESFTRLFTAPKIRPDNNTLTTPRRSVRTPKRKLNSISFCNVEMDLESSILAELLEASLGSDLPIQCFLTQEQEVMLLEFSLPPSPTIAETYLTQSPIAKDSSVTSLNDPGDETIDCTIPNDGNTTLSASHHAEIMSNTQTFI
ncbi:unnamed protein product, partial [Allacma fusca]